MLDEAARLTALTPDEAFRFDARLAVGGDGYLDCLQAAPPT
jgi:hypothetical protein